MKKDTEDYDDPESLLDGDTLTLFCFIACFFLCALGMWKLFELFISLIRWVVS